MKDPVPAAVERALHTATPGRPLTAYALAEAEREPLNALPEADAAEWLAEQAPQAALTAT